MTADVDDKTFLRKMELVACRIEDHKIQTRLFPKKKALDPLRYLPDGGGQYALFTIAAYFKEGDETPKRRHVVQRSYKQFRTLHSKLLKTYPKSHVPRDLPTMRNKKLNNKYVEEKRNELTEYMARLLQISEVRASNVLHEFLETTTAAEDSSNEDDELSIPLKMLEGMPGTIVTVKAGQSFSVTLPLGAAGDVASWQFTTKKHNIGFSATFEGEIIRPYSREGAHLKPVKGFYRCGGPGTCTLTWDNTYTWSKAKVLIYWAEVESQNRTSQLNGKRQVSNSFATSNDGVSAESSVSMPTGSGPGLDAMDVHNRRLGFIEHTRKNAMHPRHLVNSSISLLSKSFAHGGNDDSPPHGKTRHLIPRRLSGHAATITSEVQALGRGVPHVNAGSLIIQRSVNFRGQNWYRKWVVLDKRKCILRCYDSETAARRGLSSAKLNLASKYVSLAITSSLTLDAAPTPYMFSVRTKKHCWKICALSQTEYDEWENAISTAILAAQLSRRGRKRKKVVLETAKPAVREDSQSSESEDELAKAGVSTDCAVEISDSNQSSITPSRPLESSEDDDDDDDSDNKEGNSVDDDDDDESEIDSGDDSQEDNDGRHVQSVATTARWMNGRAEVSLSVLYNLPTKWKLGSLVVLNLGLLSLRLVPAVIVALVLLTVNWNLLLLYMKGDFGVLLSREKNE